MKIKSNNPLEREKKILSNMINIYCKMNHNTHGELCGDCEELLEYSLNRLGNCRYVINKPVCKNCGIHCYSPGMRDLIIKVMRFSGPRMIYYHPIDTIYYLRRMMNKDNL